MAEPVIIVAGLGRSGTSLIMQMLVAGGIESTGGTYPFWEDPNVARLPNDYKWLLGSGGKCLKILQAHKTSPPTDLNAKVIWTDRSLNQMVKSWRKVGKKLYGVKKSPSEAEIKRRLLEAKPLAKRAAQAAARPGQIMKTRFERVLENPLGEALRFQDYLDRELNIRLMVDTVRERGPEVHPKMMEAHLLNEATGMQFED